MKRKWQKLLSILSVWMILFASFAPSIAGAAEANSLANGEYTIDFKVLKDGTNETSVMNDYTAKPATVFINGNDTYVEVTLTQSDWIKVFQTKQNGTFVDAEVVSEDPEANTRIVRFPVEDLATKLDAYTHVVIPMINYDNWYTVQFQFDETSLTPVNVEQPGEEENGQLEEEVTEPGEGESGQPEEEITEPGEGESGQPEEEVTEPGEGESGQPEEEVTEPGEEESSQPEEEATEPGEGEEESKQPESPELEDGTYTIVFSALRADNDNLSSMDDYLGKPALLEVEDGKTFVSLTINEREGQLLTDVRLDTNGEWTSGTVVSEDPENLSRVVKYEVANIAAVIDAEVDMYVPRANYSNTQKFRLAFDVESITAVEEGQPEKPEQPGDETELAVGEYTIDFTVLKDGTNETSVMDGYTEKPAHLTVEEAGAYVDLTLTHSDWIKQFQTKQNGAFADAEVVLEDAEANTRVVRFPIDDINEKLDAYTHVVIPVINYDNYYTVQLLFDVNSITEVEEEQPEEPTEPEQPVEPEEPTAPEAPEVEDGTYTIDFRALRADNDNLSSMDGYLGKPALLEVEDGKTFVLLTINEREGQFLTDVRLDTNGEWTSGTVVSEDPENLSRVVKYEVVNIAAVIDAEVDMYVPRANYRNTQKFRLAFDVDSITEVEEEQPEEPTEPGQPEKPEQPGDETELAVGEYTIDFTVLKDGTNETSVMDGYTEKPAHLTVEEAGAYVDLTLTHSDWIKQFQTKQNGAFVDAEVVSEDVEANTRVVRFPIDDINEKLDAYTHVVIPVINYDNYYTVQLSFDVNSLKPVDNEPETPEIPEVIPPKVVKGEGGKLSLVIQDVRNFTYDTVKKHYEIGHRNVTAFEISSEIFAELNQDASVSFAIGDDVTAIFSVGFLQSQFAGEESITFSFHEVTDAKITEGAVSKVYDFNVHVGDKEITQFADPVTLSFAVDAQLVNKWDRLQVVYINDAGEKAEFINPTNVDSNGQTVTAQVTHFSTFGVFETASEEEEETPGTSLPNGTYTIDFTVLKNNTDEVSVMDNYTEKPATLVVQDGLQTIDLTLMNSDWIKLFQTKQNGEYVDAEVVSTDTAANKRVVRFDVQDLSAKQSAYTHVVIPELQYDNFYEVQIRFDTNSIRDEDGNIVAPNPNPNPVQPNPTAPSQPSPTNPGGGQLPEDGLKDGEYTIDFTVLKNNTNEVSVMDDYTVKPAILSVENQETYVTVTLKNSEWIKVFQTEQDGTYVDAEVVSTNAAEDTRDVRFYVADLEELVHAYTEVYFEQPILYDGKYFVQFDFDVHSITPLGEGGSGSGNNEKGSGNGTGSAEENNLSFTRDNGGNQPTTAERVTNSKTADTAMIGLLILLLAGSAFWLIRKYRLGTL